MNFYTLRILLVLCPIFLMHCSLTYSQPDFIRRICGDNIHNYTLSSKTYKANLHTLLSSITSNSKINYGFYNLTVGHNLDKVYGFSLCRGDIATSDCKTCVDYAAAKIGEECPQWNSAIGWYEKCMIHYSNTNIFKGEMTKPRYNSRKVIMLSDPKSFNRTLTTLMSRLAKEAASGDFRKKYATGEADVSSQLRIYALLQCTPNLQEFDCLNCLKNMIKYTVGECCYGREGAMAGGPSCNIRYENYQFYDSPFVTPSLPFSPPSTTVSSRYKYL